MVGAFAVYDAHVTVNPIITARLMLFEAIEVRL